MTKWTQATREAYHKEHPENFAGPDMSYPIKDGSDVGDAWGLAGHAADPDAVRTKIRSIATRLGLTSSLPATAAEGDKDRALTRAANHEPYSGTHSHPHPAHDSQGDDESHEHEHSHDNDNDHDHDHTERVSAGAIHASNRHVMSLPLVRIDAARREVWGQATAEVPDSYGTIFGYCPDAWTQWRGNIREQHDPKKAVGKAVEIQAEPGERAIYVGSRVSRGAQDTWLKVEDNVLTGYSASIIPDPEYGHDIARWPKKDYNGKQYPYLPRYTVAELSLVDNPACPGCNIQIVRADGFATEVLDTEEEHVPPPPAEPLARAGARVSSDTRSAMHTGIAHTLRAAVSQMQNCGCDSCMAAQKHIDPDGDGDIDIGSFDDPDGDAGDLYNGRDGDMERTLTGLVERIFEKQLTSVYARLQGIAGALARFSAASAETTLNTLITGAIERAVAIAAAANASGLSEVRADLSAVKATVERIDNTPMPGAPVQHASALPPRPAEKRLATDPYRPPQRSGSAVYDAIAQMSEAGMLDTPEKQAQAVAAGLMAQRTGR